MAKQTELLSVDEALARLLDRFAPLGVETVALADSLGRVLAQPITSDLNLPPFANSSMDGFALRAADTESASAAEPVRLDIGDVIAAGSSAGHELGARTCARIMTGAPLPEGADAVIPFEDVEEIGGRIIIRTPVENGACVRPEGNDLARGTVILEPGVEIDSRKIGLMAAVGCADVPVTRKPRVAILSTGNELVPPGQPLGTGQIYNSNTPMLAAAVREAGGEPMPANAATDDPDAIAAALERAGDVDLLLTSGGASVGDFDYVKDVVARGGEIGFWRVAIRPGKPLLLGSIGGRPLIGLPGNPTSSMVTFDVFVRPAIRRMLGAAEQRTRLQVVADQDIDNRGGRRTYARVRLTMRDGTVHAVPAGGQDSAMLLTLARADGLLVIPETQSRLLAGESASVELWALPRGGGPSDT
ncbi:MAG TPA: gephyrin-like molybdotransferase Glp [Chloroflexota bacterium]|nr:gephyrin-like molybdotransferase Glp [Chloroflexota bacterium]